MDLTTHKDGSYDMDKIYIDLELLKQRINYLVHAEGGMKMNDQRTKKIKMLTTKSKRLSVQHEEIKRELQYYEHLYKKVLTKIVKDKETEIEQDKKKLEELKEKCKKLDVQVGGDLLLNLQDTKTEKSKSLDVTVRDDLSPLNVQNTKTKRRRRSIVMVRNKKKKTLFEGKNTSIKDKIKIKIKENAKSKRRKLSRILKEKNTRINDKIKIQIQRNKKSGSRELFFLNDGNTRQAFSNLVQKKENNPSNIRECSITLNKLTEEQAKLYTTEKKLIEQRKNQQISQESSSQNNKTKSPATKPNWHIRIPRAVFEESQQEIQNFKLNVSDNATNVKRTRSFNR
ncbi:uncharacterized protein LOC116433050 [Nomia melanderi]|uniref:uncharacterized protein LOC116433050 n=1 Tax=Nomia melanderi TaxID=2448451 RepID=UPI001303F546|nr:spindle pole body component 110-like [Nomia melanderi]XP_031846593.1 spindle pole body component 110-like [Nomia melanderi]